MLNEIRHIRAFLAVTRHANFTRAAQELHVSQSALTVQIQQLEEALGVKLFDRNKRRVVLTDAGRQVLDPLQRLVIDTEAIVSQTREIAGLRRGIISVALLPSIASGILAEVLQRFNAAYPGIVTRIHDVVAASVIEQVRKEEVDFGIGMLTRADKELTATPLFTDRLFAFLPTNHPLSSRTTVSFLQISQYPLVLTGTDSSVRALVENALQNSSIHATPTYEVNYMSTSLSLVRAGFGIAILPEHADSMGSASGLVKLPITRPAINRHIQIIRRKGKSLSPAAIKLEEVFQKVAKRFT
jgi:LysR family transcriptional regulator, carnitine catabolism transcriptional activator